METPWETARERERDRRMDFLMELYHAVLNATEADLETEFYKDRNVNMETLHVTADLDTTSRTARFFEPMSEAELRNHGYVDEHEINLYNRVLGKLSDNGSPDTADSLCADLTWRATHAKRTQEIQKVVQDRPLSDRLGWGYRSGLNKGMLHESLYDAVFTTWNPEFYPHGSWEATSLDETPHLMFSVKQEGLCGEALLRGELLAVLGTLASRMPWPVWEDHIIFPIMIFSLIGGRGRIIQAHYDGIVVFIRKTKVFGFFEQKTAIANMNLFVRYVASTPVGDTKYYGDTQLSAKESESESESLRQSCESEDDFDVISISESNEGCGNRGWFYNKISSRVC